MRSVILDEKTNNACGICGAKEPYIEYIEKEGVHFIWCNKCNTISFYKDSIDENKKRMIENEMNFYHHEDKK